MKNVHIAFFLLFALSTYSQSIRNGVIESDFGAVATEDFDFAGVWQANRFEVVFDRELQQVVLFEFRDSITNLVFVRVNANEDVRVYKIEPLLSKEQYIFPNATLGLLEGEYFMIGGARDSSYEFQADVKLYGADALQFNEDVPESDVFFGRVYTESEDLNVFWELIRYYP
jgi:hypothetical protein